MKAEYLPKQDAARHIKRSVSWLEKKEKEGEIYHAYVQSGRRYYAVRDLENLSANFGEIIENADYQPTLRFGQTQKHNYRSWVKVSSRDF